ncbi:hypothetical protein FraQA3DRAFT_4139 [Frankia sp. QA3]|nr:hypothetical protein FraQA3DRAFT_4139 [Frankia sp. QA3]
MTAFLPMPPGPLTARKPLVTGGRHARPRPVHRRPVPLRAVVREIGPMDAIE